MASAVGNVTSSSASADALCSTTSRMIRCELRITYSPVRKSPFTMIASPLKCNFRYRKGRLMLATLQQHAKNLSRQEFSRCSHLIVVLPKSALAAPRAVPGGVLLVAILARRRMKAAELLKTPLAASLPHGGLIVWCAIDPKASIFDQHSLVCKTMQGLLNEQPLGLTIAVHGNESERASAAGYAIYVAWVNGAALPERKKKSKSKPLKTIDLYGYRDKDNFSALRARAEGNVLCRQLTVLALNGRCSNTRGHTLKPAPYMHGMHEDMNGSAVALAILLAATRADAPVSIDCWMGLAQNQISPPGYTQEAGVM